MVNWSKGVIVRLRLISVQNLKDAISDVNSNKLSRNKKRPKKLKMELEEEEDDHESLLKAN
ncbi:hypothetical protein BpHYR1_005046 [Brachionus plicatilis]|uniref:Uncharacterized protein n=1 Tax=Brachionus plicatilis TaxID=10195 RepID=A0A3M7RGB2_BRAPC|nr:hypothetical protein BpHYR1_005046 [Brachionus plicatilis]